MKKIKKDCLETIMVLNRKGNTVWPASLVNALGLSLKEAKELLAKLEKKDFVKEDDHGVLVLTAEGQKKAEKHHKKKKSLLSKSEDSRVS